MKIGIVLLKYNQDNFDVKLKKMVTTYIFGHSIINLHSIRVIKDKNRKTHYLPKSKLHIVAIHDLPSNIQYKGF